MDDEFLTQQIVITNTSAIFSKVADLCARSRKLYNFALFETRQHFFDTHGGILTYNRIYHTIKNKKDSNGLMPYDFLPSAVAQQVLTNLSENWKSFKALQEKFEKGELKNFNGIPSIPKYRKEPYFVTRFDKRAFSVDLVNNTICLLKQKYNIVFKIPKNILSEKGKIRFIRIVPKSTYFVIEVVYYKRRPRLLPDNGKALSIDLGIDNLVTATDNVGTYNPIIVNGKIVKSINQQYNKKLAKLKSKLPTGIYTSKAIKKLTEQRSKQINDQFHKITRSLVNYCINQNINTIVLGYNILWKQKVKMGKVNNQKFTSIPYYKLKQMLEYKCALAGIRFMIIDEAYTSKASCLDHDLSTGKQFDFSGKRVCRGVYRSSNGTLINADVNAAYNILRKAKFKVKKVSLKTNKLSFTNPAKSCNKTTSNPSTMGYSGCDPTSIHLSQVGTANQFRGKVASQLIQ